MLATPIERTVVAHGDSMGPQLTSLEEVMTYASEHRLSDLHLQPEADSYRLTCRCHGHLRALKTLPSQTARRWINTLKSMANLEATETERPLDAGLRWVLASGDNLSCRLSVIATVNGERAALRLHHHEGLHPSLDQLGFDAFDLIRLKRCLARHHGIILVCGPTGSGKTTTLYSLCTHLRDCGQQVMTIEDPVEQRFSGICQTSLNPDRGLSYRDALRGCLRQDPDVLVVGEIRDTESLQWLSHAAECGHLIITTLHSHCCLDALRRLHHLGISTHQLTSSVSAIVAQMLVDFPVLEAKPESRTTHRRQLLAETLVLDTTLRAQLSAGPEAWREDTLMTGNNPPFWRKVENLHRRGEITESMRSQLHAQLGTTKELLP